MEDGRVSAYSRVGAYLRVSIFDNHLSRVGAYLRGALI